MVNRIHKIVFLLLIAVIGAEAQTLTRRNGGAAATSTSSSSAQDNKNTKVNRRQPASPKVEPVLDTVPTHFYDFSQPNFTVSRIKIEHDDNGKGRIQFARKGYDDMITDPVQLSPATLDRISSSLKALNFIDSNESYQFEKDYSHLGNIEITVKSGARQRTAKFNWTENLDARALSDEYRKIGNQYIWMFDISVARENQPLETPRLVDGLDSLMRRKEISDPEQMAPFLRGLADDERLPLIARNHLTKLIKQIEKAKK